MRELKNGFISEDKTDEMKHAKLSEIDKVSPVLNTKIKELSKLDTEGTGTGDLHDSNLLHMIRLLKHYKV